MTRYFRASNDTVTVFRSTQSRDYTRASIRRAPVDLQSPNAICLFSFSASVGELEAVEITKAEYAQLVAAKTKRTAGVPYSNGPVYSWVPNSDVKVVVAAKYFADLNPAYPSRNTKRWVVMNRNERGDTPVLTLHQFTTRRAAENKARRLNEERQP